MAIEHNYLQAIQVHSGEMAEAKYLDAMAEIRSRPKDDLSDGYRQILLGQDIGFGFAAEVSGWT